MKVSVSKCWSGGNRYSFRLEHPDFERVVVPAEHEGSWCRSEAIRCLDALEVNWDVDRSKIRFEH